MKKLVVVIFLFITWVGNSQIVSYPFQNPNLPIEKRVDDIISRLTLKQKVDQLMHEAPAIPSLGIPAYNWWNEALHGVARNGLATVFPQAIGLAATFDVPAVGKTFSIISDEGRVKYNIAQRQKDYSIYKGLSYWTPNINIFRDPRWGRGMETYGEDPCLTAQMGSAVVRGLQGDKGAKYLKSLACAKHFAVHSGPEWCRHRFDACVSQRDLKETYLYAFKALVDEDVQQVMCAYNRFEGAPCCANNKLLKEILRGKWNYQNIIVTDCWAVSDFYGKGYHETHANAVDAASDAVAHSSDLECGVSYKALVKGVKTGKIEESKIDESLRRLFTARMRLGMFDPKESVAYNQLPDSLLSCQKHKEQALLMAQKSLVLLKNKQQLLPLKKTIKKIAVVGPNADDKEMLWSNYNGTPKQTVTILEGIKTKLPKSEIVYSKGCNHCNHYIKTKTKTTFFWDEKRKEAIDFSKTIDQVKDADIIVFVGGISPQLEGEQMKTKFEGFKGGDRTNIQLPKVQTALMKELKKTGKPIVFILCAGSAVAINWEDENVDAIIDAWYGGQEAGTAVADVLFGDYNPAGRLPITFYKSIKQIPDFLDYTMQDRTYRYLHSKPLYPFGYGLSYSSFEYGIPELCSVNNNKFLYKVNVTNTSLSDGEEVVQLYLKKEKDLTGPIKSLKQFVRIPLKAGESKDVLLELKNDDFCYFDDTKKQFVQPKGTYKVMIGGSSRIEDLHISELTFE